MLTVMVHAKVKKEKLEEYLELIKMLTKKQLRKDVIFTRLTKTKMTLPILFYMSNGKVRPI
jgi:hypothetical protein